MEAVLANCLLECVGEDVDVDIDAEIALEIEIDSELLESERGICLRFDGNIVISYCTVSYCIVLYSYVMISSTIDIFIDMLSRAFERG